MKKVTITFQPHGTTVSAVDGERFRDVLIREKKGMAFPCGGAGVCGKCRVKVESGGAPADHTEVETLGRDQIAKGIRLACRMKVAGDMTVRFIEHVVEERILEVGSERGVEFDPYICKKTVTVAEPTLENPVPDAERLLAQTTTPIKKLSLLQKLPAMLRDYNNTIDVVFNRGEVIDLTAPGKDGIYGVGVDIGTTTVAATLVNMTSGHHIHSVSIKNPQETFGADVISRIQYSTGDKARLDELSLVIRQAIDGLVTKLCGMARIDRREIYDVVIVGNTVMNHLFLGIDPANIAVSPYVPVHAQGVSVPAHDIGITINPQGEVFTCPNIAGFVGGDTVAGILDAGLLNAKKPLMLVDIGTNGEVALSAGGHLSACSTAAGPAFEGVNIKYGMRAGKGAIERVLITDGTLKYETIGSQRPRGICGSGIIDVVGELLKCGTVDITGRIEPHEDAGCPLCGRVRPDEKGEPEVILVPAAESDSGEDITVTQRDIREIQLAKGALAAGIQILLDRAGIKAADVGHLCLAGAFGNYIRKDAALRIGLFPGFRDEQIRFIGNAAGYGAVMMLLSRRELERSDEIRRNCEYVEVGALPDFQTYFADMMLFPER